MEFTDWREQWLHNLKYLTEISALVKALGLTPEKETELWKNLLAVLHSEETPIIFDEDAEEEAEDSVDSLLGFIQTNIDLNEYDDQDLKSNLYMAIRNLITANEGKEEYWNTSLYRLISFFMDKIEYNGDDKVLLPTGDEDITIGVLKEANAGNNFPTETLGDTDEWVKPWYNVDGKTYDQVRKCDALIDTLTRDKKLDYTHSQAPATAEEIKDWIRLIMPRYGRKVEIEDLDRNFWVIAQVISAISSYLFDEDNNGVPKLIEGMAREISEIWENVLMLWTDFAAITQNGGGNTRYIVMPLPPKEIEHGRHFDCIGYDDVIRYKLVDSYPVIENVQDNYEVIKRRLNYLTERYYGDNLCILPIVRLDNYKHNFYSMEYYPGIFTYVNAEKKWYVTPIKERHEDKLYDLIISPRYEFDARFSQHLFSSKQDYKNRIIWQYPFSDIGLAHTSNREERILMYGNLRMKSSFYLTDVVAQPLIEDFVITVKDPVGKLAYGKDREIGRYVQKHQGFTIEVEYEDLIGDEDTYGDLDSSTIYFALPDQTKDGYYMGETASWKKKTSDVVRINNLFNDSAYVLKIGNCLPYKLNNIDNFVMSSVDIDATHKNFTSMRGNVTADITPRTGPDCNRVTYYRFNWNTYNPQYDGNYNQAIPDSLGRKICFEMPKEYGTDYITEGAFRYDGLVAAKNFILSDPELRKSPCYILTTVGLTPWNGAPNARRIYWDSSFVSHIYFYIPTIESLTEDPVIGSRPQVRVNKYVKEYNKYNALEGITNPSDSTLLEVNGIISIPVEGQEEPLEVGKIISCQIINRYEGYFGNYRVSNGNIFTQPGWRQFFVINDDIDGNKCEADVYNDGDVDSVTDYTATFNPNFTGYVRYYDARWKQNIEPSQPIYGNKHAQVSEAHIVINDQGYKQDRPGKIMRCNGNDFDTRTITVNNATVTNEAYNENYTNFQMVMSKDTTTQQYKENVESIYDLFAKSPSLTNVTFHGNTPLFGIRNNFCCIYNRQKT